MMKGVACTTIKYLDRQEITAVNMTTATYLVPTPPTIIENYLANKTVFAVPFRASVRGHVMQCSEDFSVSQSGNALRHFDLMDKRGAYIHCIAFDRHVYDDKLKDGIEIVVYFGTGRAGIGSAVSGMYLYNDAVIVQCSNEKPTMWLQNLIEFPERRP